MTTVARLVIVLISDNALFPSVSTNVLLFSMRFDFRTS